VEEALNILTDPSITQWDKEVVKVLINVLKTDNFKIKAEKEELIRYKDGKYDRENSSLKFKQFTTFFGEKE